MTLDYDFEPSCPKCRSPSMVARILDSTDLVCRKCLISFKIREEKSQAHIGFQ